MMFAGMVILDSNSTHNADGDFKCGRNSTVREGGCVMATEVDNQEAGVYRRTIRRLGYMRAKVDCAMGLTGRDLRDLHIQSGAQVSCPFTGQIAEDKTFILSSNQDQHEECSEGDGPELAYQNIYSLLQGGDGQTKPSYKQRSPSAVDYSKSIQPGYTFNSSFSFIQQSLNMNIILDAHMNKCPFLVANTEPSLHDSMPVHAYGKDILSVGQLPFSVTVSGQSDKSQKSFLNGEIPGVGQNVPSHSGDRHVYLSVTSDFQDNMPDSDLEYLDTEVTSSFSVNYSDSTSASSVTSGYGSTTSFLDQNWNDMLKKYEEGLQNCLHENGIKSKIELMMLKIQMLQQKSALDDDYKTAVHFGSMLEELKEDVEDDFLKLGLPSQHPNVTFFLERLRMTIHNALQRTNSECRQNKESTDCHMLMSALGTQQSREQLIQEKEQIQKQMMELQHMLGELQKQRLALGEQLNQDDLRLEKEVEERVLRSYSPTQLHLIGRVLEDLITSQHRDQISLSPSQSITSLQEQKQDLGLSNKEAASKVIMSHSQHFWQVGLPMGFGSNMVKSQRLSDSLQSKVCENETQLLDQHEAKLATISGGNDFSSAEEVKAEMKSLYRERECLDSLSKRMLALSTASNQNLVCVKEQQSQLKEEQQKNFAQHEQNLKENTVKYSELLEDILHSHGHCSRSYSPWKHG
ncbi:disrupted in schizophrenia 1 protein isoform X2 [Electrophorus electricus]|uniref:disrupted in schizophrenia 1 protein isoform X2 n=1 Tax=Electrophorus electricus TaxID=8005 RepID=UPI0015D071FB|nr:disrupted in schizophrenia 1 protein isoform X2 [Electrophorus electricus]